MRFSHFVVQSFFSSLLHNELRKFSVAIQLITKACETFFIFLLFFFFSRTMTKSHWDVKLCATRAFSNIRLTGHDVRKCVIHLKERMEKFFNSHFPTLSFILSIFTSFLLLFFYIAFFSYSNLFFFSRFHVKELGATKNEQLKGGE